MSILDFTDTFFAPKPAPHSAHCQGDTIRGLPTSMIMRVYHDRSLFPTLNIILSVSPLHPTLPFPESSVAGIAHWTTISKVTFSPDNSSFSSVPLELKGSHPRLVSFSH